MNYDNLIVGGLGRVGLPLGLVWAEAGLTVGVYDLGEAKIWEVCERRMPFLKHGAEPILNETLRDYFAGKGLKLHVSFCPERVMQGHAVAELRDLPHIVASCSLEGRAYCVGIFRLLNDRIIEVGVKEAELAELYSNAWRYITFAVANQFYMMTEKSGASAREIHRAMTEGYECGCNIRQPGFAAGPSLLKDTLQLSAFNANNFNLGHAAMLMNEGLPAFCIEQLWQNHNLKGMTVGLLGMAFKADVDDDRGSLAFKLRKLLALYGAGVLCTDEYIQGDDFRSLGDVLKEAALFIVYVPHEQYRTLEFPPDKPVFNIWNIDSVRETWSLMV